MALVTKLEKQALERDSEHRPVKCTYTLVTIDGQHFLQLDTYGSTTRRIKGKKSQSMRFSREALQQLIEVCREAKLIK